jgi:predicted ATPase/class 3 adenylate cyclase/Tfp pilus assembly protein PilF
MTEVPSGTVTFLFTDIEGSTVCWERHPAGMRDALARHDALLQAGITAHGGVVVTERGEGDSFFALFARPSDAVAAACALQRALVAEPWPEEVAPLRVRMALHTGEAGLREGGDYRGSAVNRCARLRGVGHGGQVLLSAATYELVRDALPADTLLRDLGVHRLKDLARPEHIYQVLIPALPGEFPPLKTLDRQRHNLPVQPTALIGREREVTAVAQRLLAPDTRLLTLTGAGGIGKTRLAVQVAAEVSEDFPDGVYFVNLAPLSDPTLVLPTIAQTLGVREDGSQPLREALHAVLRAQHLLLLLDNFEQILDAAPVVSDLLAACAGVRIMVTSRAALHLRGERLYPVPPLALPELTPLPPLERLTQYEAVRLFIERAQDVKPDFAVTNATAPAVAEICARLDGLPLALELAAARVRLLPPEALLARLSHRLRVVTGGARDLPERQRTLRATIDWSYSLLTVQEQTLFVRLAVFVGGTGLEAIEAICNADGVLEVLGGVDSLLEKSLLVQTEGNGETRMTMLETLHEYARERLEASEEAEGLCRAHAAYFLALAEEAEPHLTGAEQGTWLGRLEAEHDNLRAVLRWARERQTWEEGLRLAAALMPFWEVRGHWGEGRDWLQVWLAGVRPPGVPSGVLGRALHTAGRLAYLQGDYGPATAMYEEALALHRELGDELAIAASLNGLGAVANRQGEYGRATAQFEEALALFRERGDRLGIAQAANGLGNAATRQGELGRATALYEEALALRRELGDRWGIAVSLHNLGIVVAELQGEYGRATALFAEALALYRELGNHLGIAHVLHNLGAVAELQGEYGRATALHEEALTLFRELGNRDGMSISLNGLGEVARSQGDYGRAATLFAEALQLHHATGSQANVALMLEGLAWVAAARKQALLAARLGGAAEALREALGSPLPPSELADQERAVQAMSAALGSEAFAAAWAQGRALPLEETIALALESVVELPPGP